MYTSSMPFEKSSGCSENASISRSNRIPVGITSIGDENQQIRIHLAVHKYNNVSNISLHNRRSLISPNRQFFLRSSPKLKSNESDLEQAEKIEKKYGNRYEGVGTYPTVHLKKSSVLYRPIRRLNDIKIPNPELPVNRFSNHLHEINPDLKQNTRSVLDVLQDMSRKRINSKEGDPIKSTSKGLGGDLCVGAEATYKPLFVPKEKFNSILTRDSTTQTLLSSCSESGKTEFCNSNLKSDALDPRAELRKKLARKNNEIFASLSSSVTSYAIKRKLDKAVTASDTENANFISLAKKSKRSEGQGSKDEENNLLEPLNGFKTNFNENSGKITRKNKTIDLNSCSPNKDRLTTIFLDMQDTSSKTEIFENGLIFGDKNSPEKNSSVSPPICSNVFLKTNDSDTKGLKSFITKDSLEPNLTSKDTNNVKNFSLSNPVTEIDSKFTSTPSVPQFRFGTLNTAETFTMNSSLKPTNKDLSNEKVLSFTKQPLGSNTENMLEEGKSKTYNSEAQSKNNNENKTTSEQLKLKSSVEHEFKTNDFKLMNFGCDKVQQSTQPLSPAIVTSDVAKAEVSVLDNNKSVTNSTYSSDSGYNFNHNSNDITKTVTTIIPNNNQLTQSVPFSSTQSPVSTSVKPLYTFGQNPLPSLKSREVECTNKLNENPAFSQTNIIVSSSSSQNLPVLTNNNLSNPGIFAFGEKSDNSLSSKENKGEVQGSKNSLNEPVLPNKNPSEPSSVLNTSQTSNIQPKTTNNSEGSTAQTLSLATESHNKTNTSFTFGQKSEISEVPSNLGTIPTTATEEKKQPQCFTFSFGPKSETQNITVSKNSGGNVFGQKSSLFAFGQKSPLQEPSQSVTVPNTTFSQSNITQAKFGSCLSSTQPTVDQTNAFGQNIPQAPNTTAVVSQALIFGKSSELTTQTTSAFGTKSEPNSVGQPSLSGQFVQNNTDFSNKTPLFGSSSSTKSVCGFEPSPTSQPSGFGVASSTQSSNAFGTTVTTQPIAGFGVPSTTSTSRFELNSQSQVSSFTQPFGQSDKLNSSVSQSSNSIFSQTLVNQNPSPGSNFGASSGQTNIFGQTSFGQTSTSQSCATQNKFSFGISSSENSTSTNSLPNTSTVFNFSGSNSSQNSVFSFGSNPSSGSNNSQTPFNFTNNDNFKFGVSNEKDGSSFNSSNPSTFNFGETNNIPTPEVKVSTTAFSFGNPQVTSPGSAFNFGSTPSPSVFSFGGSGSSTSSGSTFNFGIPQTGISFGKMSSPSSATPFSIPGTFSIGSGSSQPRPRASSRLRRRP